MFLCIVFASPLKVLIDTIDFENKETKELIEEESGEKEESKTEKEVYSKYTSLHDSSETNYSTTSLKTVFQPLLRRPIYFLKVPTPPPDLNS